MKESEILYFCSRCHDKFVPFGEVVEWGKHYPEMKKKFADGHIEIIKEHTEIKKALCVDCMHVVNKNKYDLTFNE